MDNKKRGHYCSAANCKNYRNITKKSFFRFPKDLERAKTWVVRARREDLLPNLENLHKNNRLCGAHFEKKMFLNDLQNRLQPNAEPTMFPSIEAPTEFADHTYTNCYSPIPELKDITEIKSDVEDIVTEPDEPMFFEIINPKPEEQPPEVTYSISSTQTPMKLLHQTERDEKLRKQIKNLQAKIKKLDDKIKENEAAKENTPDITLEQYKMLTHKFCASTELANFINVLVMQSNKQAKRLKT